VLIATDDPALQEFALGFGAKVIMTSPSCPTGTDRVAEASLHFPEHTIFFSLQGDAVLTPPWVIDDLLQAMLKDPNIQIATPAVRLKDQALSDFLMSKQQKCSSGTTVVFDQVGNALYFSKALIPYSRDEHNPERPVFRHIGLYAYRKQTLLRMNQLPEGPLEKAEKLEQLRALENGIPIRVVQVDYRGRTHGSVDRVEDLAVVEAIIQKEGELI
jgi:3-deoxy-manno-octulosonate cytidylyltransferase (CMP-KDO synthetase)